MFLQRIANILGEHLVFTVALLGAVLAVSLVANITRRPLLWWLRAEAIVIGLAIIYLGVLVFQPLFAGSAKETEEEAKLELPQYAYTAWENVPVQADGRIKPFQTAARESVRQITGREKFKKQDPVAVVLQWMLFPGGTEGHFVNWEHTAFILCDHQGLRKAIYAHLPAPQGTASEDERKEQNEQLHGKYVSPADLRNSPGFKALIDSGEAKHQKDKEKASQLMSPEERKAEEVAGRLVLFDKITQRDAGSVIDGERHHPDPFQFVALDPVPSGPWLSLGDLHDIESEKGKEDGKWRSLMYGRLSQMPQLYISPESKEALKQFQDMIKAGQGTKAIDELAEILRKRSEEKVEEFEKAQKGQNANAVLQVFGEIAKTQEEKHRIIKLVHGANKDNRNEVEAAMSREIRSILAERDQKVVEELKHRVLSAKAKGYHPDKDEFRMLHLDYLEARFPKLYIESAMSKEFPKADADRVLASQALLVQAYKAGKPDQFDQASQDFLGTLREVSAAYTVYPGNDTVGGRLAGLFTGRLTGNPGSDLLSLELQLNRVEPFLWAWIIMLVSIVCLVASLALKSRAAYFAGLTAYSCALLLEMYGFFARITIAGRPPVSNMYETLIWVSFMSAVFALVLELIYQRKVIGLAGAAVSTLALVLAAQLPLDLGVKIGPIVPVLRSNYWLTIHVLTIVSSYAAGTLAWGLANIALALLAFGRPSRELLKTLSHFTYRAVQIAVILLATGTFLGGWWAAESWGRFWGWDPKEVWALIALVCYVIPLHARYIGWVKDFGLAVAAVLCYAAIVMSWYGVNFVLGAGLHSYGFGSGGPWWIFWAGLINIEWVLVASIIYQRKTGQQPPALPDAGLTPQFA